MEFTSLKGSHSSEENISADMPQQNVTLRRNHLEKKEDMSPSRLRNGKAKGKTNIYQFDLTNQSRSDQPITASQMTKKIKHNSRTKLIKTTTQGGQALTAPHNMGKINQNSRSKKPCGANETNTFSLMNSTESEPSKKLKGKKNVHRLPFLDIKLDSIHENQMGKNAATHKEDRSPLDKVPVNKVIQTSGSINFSSIHSLEDTLQPIQVPDITMSDVSDMKANLLCPVCYRYMCAPMSICDQCFAKIMSCPICGGPKSDANCYTLEAIASRLRSQNPSTLASLPMIGMNYLSVLTPLPSQASQHNRLSAPLPQNTANNGKGISPLSNHSDNDHGVGTISDRSHNPSTLASLPMIGMDDFSILTPLPSQASQHNRLSAPLPQNTANNGKGISPLSNHSDNDHGVGTISDRSQNPSTLASLPMIGMDYFSVLTPLPSQASQHNRLSAPLPQNTANNGKGISPLSNHSDNDHGVGTISDRSQNPSTLASLPMIGMDYFSVLTPLPSQASQHNRLSAPLPQNTANNGKGISPLSNHSDNDHGVGTISDRSHNPSTLASLPMIGMDYFSVLTPLPSQASQHNRLSAPLPQNTANNGKGISPLSNHSDNDHGVGTISDRSQNPSTLASLPIIGMDYFSVLTPLPSQASQHNRLSAPLPQNTANNGKGISPLSNHSNNDHGVGTISDSSSSSSDSDSDSDSPDNVKIKNGYGNSTSAKVNGNDLATLDEDLCLSESESDSD